MKRTPAAFTAMGNQDGLRAAWVTYEDGTTEQVDLDADVPAVVIGEEDE